MLTAAVTDPLIGNGMDVRLHCMVHIHLSHLQ
jgi:hypothetical protein